MALRIPRSESSLHVTALGASSHVCQAARTVRVDQFAHLCGDFIDGLVPGNRFELIAHPLQRLGQAVCGVLMIENAESLAAGIALTARIRFIGFYFGHTIVFDKYLKPAILCTQYTTGFMPGTHNTYLVIYYEKSSFFGTIIMPVSAKLRDLGIEGLRD